MFFLYDKITGKITSTISAPDSEMIFYENSSTGALHGDVNSLNYYVLDGVLTERPLNTISINKTECLANGTDEIIFSSVPPNTKVTIIEYSTDEYFEYSLLEGTDSFTSTIKSGYMIIVDSFPYQSKVFIIHAN